MRKRKMVPWWSDDCKEVVKSRNIKSNHSYTNLMDFQRAQSKVKRVVREAKRKYWREFCGKIGAEVKVGDVWNMIKKMGGISSLCVWSCVCVCVYVCVCVCVCERERCEERETGVCQRDNMLLHRVELVC